ncbi:hypothetical protein [Streptomyces sp. NPDC020965]|uniref:hypothetical protein n=1 Tax=Streptomyces sp. NPDC020965 TaxID=3365105 RepID=UPI003794CCB5
MRLLRGVVVAALGIALTGCGVQPTGVVGAGESADGLTRGARLYFASPTGLRSVPVLNRDITDLNMVMKLLSAGPSQAETEAGLTTLVHELGGYAVEGKGTRVTVYLTSVYQQPAGDQGTGQLVCTLARTQSVIDPKVRADDVEVTLRPATGDKVGPFRCAEFLGG